MTLLDQVVKDIQSDEGFKGTLYRCSKGKVSIAWGHNVEDEPLPPIFQDFYDRHGYITQTMGEALLVRDLGQAEADCQRMFTNWAWIPEEIKRVFLNMAFNMGYRRFQGFHNLDACAEAGDWPGVIREMKDSEWYREDVPNRARRLVALIEAYITKPKEKQEEKKS
jgi:GH24 family phage-related lysozyme (muramidase)